MTTITIFNEHNTCTNSIYKLSLINRKAREMGWKEERLKGNIF